MVKNLTIHFMRDFKAKAYELSSTDYENVNIFCKFEDEYFNEEVADQFLSLLESIKSVNNSFSLDLRDNNFNDAHMKRIANAIGKHSNLKELLFWFPCNNISDDGAIDLINLLDTFRNLRQFTLNLEWNFRISNKSLSALCKKMPNMSQLQKLKVLISKFV